MSKRNYEIGLKNDLMGCSLKIGEIAELKGEYPEYPLLYFAANFLKAKHIIEISYHNELAVSLYGQAARAIEAENQSDLKILCDFCDQQLSKLVIDRSIYTSDVELMFTSANALKAQSQCIIEYLDSYSDDSIKTNELISILHTHLYQKAEQDKLYAEAIVRLSIAT